MRLVFMGTPDFAVPSLQALLEAGYEIALVVTQPDKPKGRGKGLVFSPVKEAALQAGLPLLQPERIRQEEVLTALKKAKADAIIVAAFGQIIPKAILDLPPFGCLNVHASLLPKYRGAAPIQHAILDGESVTGVTIMQMGPGLDTGDILSTVEIPLAADETAGTLFDKLSRAGAALLVQTLPRLEAGEVTPLPQPADSPTPYAGMITKDMGKIRFGQPAWEIERLVRGMNPWPSAYASLEGKLLKIWASKALPNLEGSSPCSPGTIRKTGKEGILVQCGQGCLLLTEVQLEGKKRLSADAFLRGFPLQPGQTFDPVS